MADDSRRPAQLPASYQDAAVRAVTPIWVAELLPRPAHCHPQCMQIGAECHFLIVHGCVITKVLTSFTPLCKLSEWTRM